MPVALPCFLRARYVVTQDSRRRVLENAIVAVADGRVLHLGSSDDMRQRYPDMIVTDLGDAMLMPGLVNAHTHAAMTFLRGMADDLPLEQWLQQHIFPVEQALTKEIVYYASLLGYAEMLRTGTTACADMYLFMDEALRAADVCGIRCTAGEAVFSFPSAASPAWEQTLDITVQRARNLQNNPRLNVMVCPHAIYTTTPEILEKCRDTAQTHALHLQMHLAETATECARCEEQHGQSPVAYAAALGLFGENTSFAHVVHTSDADLALLQRDKPIVAHNPSSNMKLASGIARVPQMLEDGIPLALGTDGAASNNCLNMFMEMSRAALLHKVSTLTPTVTPAQTVLDMATLGGAPVLGVPRLGDAACTGSIVPGAAADMIALNLRAPNMRPLYNPVSHLVYAATGHEVIFSMVNGKIVYHNGTFTGFDYPALCAEMDSIAGWVRKKIQ